MKSEFLLIATAFAGICVAAAIGAAGFTEPPRGESRRSPVAEQSPATPPTPAAPGGMISNSISSPPVIVHMPSPQPPIVAIPRQPGPTDLMTVEGRSDLRTLSSHGSPEDCDLALDAARQNGLPHAFCVSTASPPPEPDHAELLVIGPKGDLLGIRSFPSMPACEQSRSRHARQTGEQILCTKIKWH